jgi:menaquinone-dependent protoporphyrinogen IX oxidase
MNRILIAYVSHSGSTREIAQYMGSVLSTKKLAVEVKAISEVTNLSSYTFIIAGGLLYRFGWHPEIVQFLKNNIVILQTKQVALFVTGLRLVATPDCSAAPYPIFIDPAMLKSPVDQNNRRENKGPLDAYTTLKGYLQATLPTIEKICPVSLAFFAGKVDLHTLRLPEKMIMMLLLLLVGKKPGDYRNWEAIKVWVTSLKTSNAQEKRLEETAIPESV